MRRFYDDRQSTRRFLVADPVGMGKTFVARGVIARTIERLDTDDSVERIDVIYVCSNSDIASQNIRRLDVRGGQTRAPARRLTLLATRVNDLERPTDDGAKTVNLVAFTPGTSFELAGQGGIANERALLHLLLTDHYDLGRAERTASKRILQGGVTSLERFQRVIDGVAWQIDAGVDPNITRPFLRNVTRSKAGRDYRRLVDSVAGRKPTKDEATEAWNVIGELRNSLARASIDALQPDLVILDEFQRFKHLLDRSKGGDAAELAHHLFDHPGARVLLLSATPYKMYTLAEEASLGEDHHKDFIDTIRFLAEGTEVTTVDVTADLAELRAALIQRTSTGPVATRLSARLRQVMCRTERPDLDGQGMLSEQIDPTNQVRTADLLGYVALRRVADIVDGALSVEYWKSAPYFLNFLEGYQLGTRLREALEDHDRRLELRSIIRSAQRLDRDHLRSYRPVDPGNAKLRYLHDQTVGAGWWKLLWLPPSLQYHAPGGPWAEAWLAPGVTKLLVFSSWAATPTAIASLLSYEAERLGAAPAGIENTPEARRRIGNRLDFRLTEGRPAAMTTLGLLWPFPDLARRCDPLELARSNPGETVSLDQMLVAAENAIRSQIGGDGLSKSMASDAWYWTVPLRADRSLRALLDGATAAQLAEALAGTAVADEDDTPDPVGLTAHVQRALDTLDEDEKMPQRPDDLTSTVALLGLASPGNVAWRALGRLLHDGHTVTPLGHWRAAAILAAGFRTLFNRPDSTLVVDQLLPGEPYWRNVLTYCAWGGLQAVVDEYLHHLAEDQGYRVLDDGKIVALAERARSALALRPATYRAFDPLHPHTTGVPLLSRFALRYGTLRQRDEDARLPELRAAFNSPFRPFVLATTSIGQEGVDFHWWCHAVVHWNAPPSPVDFEQREGRVTRYKGHAIRRNIAAAHRSDALRSKARDPWDAAFDAAAATRPAGANDLFPYWVYPGPAAIERHIPQFPLSRDDQRYQRVRNTLTLYRLAFGQPRQEDLLALLQHGDALSTKDGDTGLVDLRPRLNGDASG
ncbi:MAG: helicase C-terminal domain-containing protein [Actinomycetota bacterium]|nr:helicase C-terminal domain-containing protein [Actinomycetota bacterium]